MACHTCALRCGSSIKSSRPGSAHAQPNPSICSSVLNASASAKLLNVATNVAAIILFSLKGHVWWHFALPLAVANVLGSVLGTHMALKHGTGFVRGIFIAVVSLLILKTGYDAFLR